MTTRLVNLARKNKLLESVIKAFVWLVTQFINLWDELTGFLRCHGLMGKQYAEILAQVVIAEGRKW